MSALINREAAIAYSISGMTREIDGDKWIRVSEVRESIKTMPSAQPERKKGHWIDTGSGQECSVCHEIQCGYDNYRHFCANCGADMRGEEG